MAKVDLEYRQKLHTDPKFNNLSIVHPENDNPAKDWEVINKEDVPAKERNQQPVVQ